MNELELTPDQQSQMSETYTLTLTKAQLELLSQAAELISRIGIGQFTDVLDWLPLKTGSLDNDAKLAIAGILKPRMIHDIDGWSSSLGIHHADTPAWAQILWDVHQVIRHKLAWERAVEQGIIPSMGAARKWPEMITVDYDQPMGTSDEPLARVERVERPAGRS